MLITNIQRFSLHDGPGIRTTVFLKGCSLQCPWCSNPENIEKSPQTYIKDGQEGVYGKKYIVEEIFNEIIKDKVFYEKNGGVTFSGGEPLLEIKDLIPLIRMLKNEKISVAVETCLFIPKELLELAVEYIDIFYVDMKIIDKTECKRILRKDISEYISNLNTLCCSSKPLIIRVPVIGGYTDGDKNRKKVIKLLKQLQTHIAKIELIKEHSLGALKYKSLGLPIPCYKGVSEKLMEQYKKEIENEINVPVEICKI